MTGVALRRRVAQGLDRLEAAFGKPRLGRRLPPLDELVLTILSQNTSDRNRDRAYASLRRRFPTWERALRADRAALEEAIRVGGLSRIKSVVIQEALRRVMRDQGRLSLEVLKRMPAEEARQYLKSFRGVGEKTACCVLLFSCGHPAFPVDTHIHRVTRRLGWVPARSDAGRSHAILGDLIPRSRYLTAHVNLITLGRRRCHPRAPECPRCPLLRVCRHGTRARLTPFVPNHGGRVSRQAIGMAISRLQTILKEGRREAVSGSGRSRDVRGVQGRSGPGRRGGAGAIAYRRPEGPRGERNPY